MKKRKTYRWLFVEPYQYIALQNYLNKMTKKGWKLVSVFGSTSCWLTFEKKDNIENEYYLVDYTNDFSALTPETETEEAKKYRGFVEEFGYEYVGSNGALQIYRTNSDQKVLRDNNEDDMKILQKSVWKSSCFDLLLFLIFGINFVISVQNVKKTLYTSNASIFSQVLMGLFCLELFFSNVVPFIYWMFKRKPFQSSKWLQIASHSRTFVLLIVIIVLLGFMISFEVVLYMGIIIMFIVSFYSLIRYSRCVRRKYLVYGGILVLCLFFFQVFTKITFLSLAQSDTEISDKSEEIFKIINEKDVKVATYEQNSILSNELSISITYPDDTFVYIQRYQIQDGILSDWVKDQYEKEEVKQIMCPGFKEGTNKNGKMIYEGDGPMLIVDGKTYLIVAKEFILDDAGWEKINQLIEL